jgi:uncharacterized protein (DUF2336 family)
MIVRQFLQWIRTAPACARADATGALARAYLYSDLSAHDRSAAEGAMVMMLDDPSPLVRHALAEALADSDAAPLAIILALTADLPEIATYVLVRSPLLLDADLVDTAGGGDPARQAAISRRAYLSCVVSAALAEVGTAEACLILVENAGAEIAPFSLERIAERFGHLAAVREAMFAREDLTASLHQRLAVKLGESLITFVTSRDWMGQDRARNVVQEACDKVTVAIAAKAPDEEVQPLVRHLMDSGQLNVSLLLRALLSGNLALFEEALAELSGLPLARVARLVHGRSLGGLRAVLAQAGLPEAAFPTIWAAIEAEREVGYVGDFGAAAHLKRRMVERVLTQCEGDDADALAPLLSLLRRFSLEATREEARLFCDELAAA